jgi:hypothetical protein
MSPMEYPEEWFVCPDDAMWCLDAVFAMVGEGHDDDWECMEGDTDCGYYTDDGFWMEYETNDDPNGPPPTGPNDDPNAPPPNEDPNATSSSRVGQARTDDEYDEEMVGPGTETPKPCLESNLLDVILTARDMEGTDTPLCF